jgi:hypothetical protein
MVLFGKSAEMTRYQKGIKVRHGMKIMEFQINSVSKSMTAKHVNLEIINEFFDFIPK